MYVFCYEHFSSLILLVRFTGSLTTKNKYKHDIAFLPKQNVRCHGRRNVLP